MSSSDQNPNVDQSEVDDLVTYRGESIYPYDMPEEVDVREEPQSVFEWMRKLGGDRLVTDPDFQRNFVWDRKQKSQFIESVLLNIPLLPLYVNERHDGKYVVVDGRQRTTTLDEYINKRSFALSDLKVLKDLNGKKFDKLPLPFQTRIEDKKFYVYVIKPSVPLRMVFDIFHRINTGGTQLSAQEIRNCFYIGHATRLLKRLSEKEYFRDAIGNSISPKRMRDREAILRYIAFRHFDFRKNYKNDMDAYLGLSLSRMNVASASELKEIETDFERVMKSTYSVFGDANFRLPTENTKGRLNIALMESVSYFFSGMSETTIQENRAKIKRNFKRLLQNPAYIDAIKISTGDTRRVLARFDLASKIMGEFDA
jgi:uncharacterized protein with ParB-like and HNH nuclease domain